MHTNKSLFRNTLALIIVAIMLSLGVVPVLADTQVETVASFEPGLGQFPEGIALDKTGNIFVSFELLGQVWKISPDGDQSLFYDFQSPGALGLAVDAPGNVYVARGISNGVWQIDRNGEQATLIPGSVEILFPNSLAFDKVGNLYVTDSSGTYSPESGWTGAIWRIPPGGEAEIWLEDPLLTGTGELGFGIPIGANGIAYRHGQLYVANTEQALVVRIPVLVDGSPGEPSILVDLYGQWDPATQPIPPYVDGLTLDVFGNIYPLLIGQSRLVRIDPTTGTITTLATQDDGLDFPASLAFGTGNGDRKSVFVTNYALYNPVNPQPGILKINVSMPGLPLP